MIGVCKRAQVLVPVDLPDAFDIANYLRIAYVDPARKFAWRHLFAAVIAVPVELKLGRKVEAQQFRRGICSPFAMMSNRVGGLLPPRKAGLMQVPLRLPHFSGIVQRQACHATRPPKHFSWLHAPQPFQVPTQFTQYRPWRDFATNRESRMWYVKS